MAAALSMILVVFGIVFGFDELSFHPLALVFLAGTYILSFLSIDRAVPMRTSRTPGVLGEHVITILPEGVNERTVVSDLFRAWILVKSIEWTNDYIYLFLDTTTAHIVPARAFPSVEEAIKFRDLALSYWVDARASRPPRTEEARPM